MPHPDSSVEAVAAYVERRAAEHRQRSLKSQQRGHDSYHRGTAVLFDALASDIRAGLHQA